jgi:tRNA(fMet)-specific endonuclease VapC
MLPKIRDAFFNSLLDEGSAVNFLLDTNACIRLLKGDSPNLLARMEQLATTDIGIPSIVRFELYYGAGKSNRAAETAARLDAFLAAFRTCPVDDNVAAIAGKIRVDLEKRGLPVGPYDLLIAATALASGSTLITANTGEFSRIPGLAIDNWEALPPG